MNLETRLTATWRNRFLFVALMIIGFAAWFFYDGLVTWPAEAQRFEEYDRIATEMMERGEASGRESREVKMAWERFAEAQGWSKKTPSERTDEDIQGQFTWGTGTGLVGLLFLGWVLWHQTLKIRADDQFVYSARGKPVPWESIKRVDRSKWEKKGIAVAIYEEAGKEKKLILDDYKFAGAEAIIKEIERRLGVEYTSPLDEDPDEAEEPDGADAQS